MKTNLVKYLICPTCKKSLFLSTKIVIKNDVKEGILRCDNNHKFFIINGIPRMLTDKNKNFLKTKNAFSSKWSKFYKNYQSKKWYDFTEKWFLDRFGWKNKKKFNEFLKDKKFILDAGTGIGNSAKRFSVHEGNQVFAIDASESIDYARKKFGKIKNIHFIQADILNLPFKKKFFDFIVSDQVLHHTKNTQLAVKSLVSHLKKNGIISIYVYNKKGPIREFVDDFIREKTIKMSENDCLKFSKQITKLGKAFSKLDQKITITEDIPILNIKAGTFDVQRFLYWNVIKCFWANDGNFQRSVGVNYDWYYPKFAWRHTKKEVKEWFTKLNLKISLLNEVESGINISGKKK